MPNGIPPFHGVWQEEKIVTKFLSVNLLTTCEEKLLPIGIVNSDRYHTSNFRGEGTPNRQKDMVKMKLSPNVNVDDSYIINLEADGFPGPDGQQHWT
jgi:hypothetical protein